MFRSSLKSRFLGFTQEKFQDLHPKFRTLSFILCNGKQHFVEYKDYEDFIDSESDFMKSHYSVDSTGKGDWRMKKSKVYLKDIKEIMYQSKHGKTENGTTLTIDFNPWY